MVYDDAEFDINRNWLPFGSSKLDCSPLTQYGDNSLFDFIEEREKVKFGKKNIK